MNGCINKIWLFLLLFGVAISAVAQPKISFSEREFDFGTFKEDAGIQSHSFTITNSGNQPLVIQRVTTTCGCTTSEWTQKPIAAGENGVVTVSYDPLNRPGKFSKSVTIYSNGVPSTATLIIKGEVEARQRTIEEIYTFKVGDIRFESNLLSFSDIKKNEKKVRTMQFINTSDRDITVGFNLIPPFLKVDVTPQTVKAGQRAIVAVTFDATKNSNWGENTSLLNVTINGVEQDKGYFYVFANLVEDFSHLSEQDIANAPICDFKSKIVDLGNIKESSIAEVVYEVTNSGKSDLIIREIKSSCACISVKEGMIGRSIKPNESTQLIITFDSKGYRNNVTRTLYLYTNTPSTPETVLRFTANVK